MKIAIIGYGRMGHEVERVARLKGIGVASIIDRSDKGATHSEISRDALRDADVAIDFTSPKSALENMRKVSGLGKSLVVGTTGWYDQLDEGRRIVAESHTGLIYSSNFSLGVNLFFRIVESAAQLVNRVEDYDVYSYELHHNQKLDSPSGTAKALADILMRNIHQKKQALYEKLERKIEPHELHVASVRAGWIPGTHVVGFDSEADTIELSHVARNRSGFAFGAVAAAAWLQGKKGFFTMDDMLKDILG